MTTKQYLSQYRALYIDLDAKMDDIIQRKSTLIRMTASYSAMPKGGGVDWSDQMLKLIDEEQTVRALFDKVEQLRHDIEDAIDAVQPPKFSTLLRLKYINGYSLLKISDIMRYDYDYVRRMHGEALQAVNIIHNHTFSVLK